MVLWYDGLCSDMYTSPKGMNAQMHTCAQTATFMQGPDKPSRQARQVEVFTDDLLWPAQEASG